MPYQQQPCSPIWTTSSQRGPNVVNNTVKDTEDVITLRSRDFLLNSFAIKLGQNGHKEIQIKSRLILMMITDDAIIVRLGDFDKTL